MTAKTITKALMGADAVAEAMRQINPDVVPVYPITPQTEIAQKFAKFVSDGKVDSEMIRVESEHSAMSCSVGASAAGARVMTATASAGLALMWEIVGVAGGLRLPIVMSVVNRALSAPINIHCDHSDSMGARDLGWIQIYSENAQEAYENTLLAVRLAEKVNLPVMVMQDGFIISHGMVNVNIFDDESVKAFIGEKKYEFSLLDTDKPITHGPLQLQDYYFETRVQQAIAIEESKNDYLAIGKELSSVTGNEYTLFEEYQTEDAEAVMVVLSSTAGVAKQVIDKMRIEGKKVGLIRPRLFRPFPYTEIGETLKKFEKIVILDRSEGFGANAPLYSEVKNALYDAGVNVPLCSCVFGLGGRNIFESDIEDVFDRLLKGELKSKEFVGLR